MPEKEITVQTSSPKQFAIYLRRRIAAINTSKKNIQNICDALIHGNEDFAGLMGLETTGELFMWYQATKHHALNYSVFKPIFLETARAIDKLSNNETVVCKVQLQTPELNQSKSLSRPSGASASNTERVNEESVETSSSKQQKQKRIMGYSIEEQSLSVSSQFDHSILDSSETEFVTVESELESEGDSSQQFSPVFMRKLSKHNLSPASQRKLTQFAISMRDIAAVPEELDFADDTPEPVPLRYIKSSFQNMAPDEPKRRLVYTQSYSKLAAEKTPVSEKPKLVHSKTCTNLAKLYSGTAPDDTNEDDSKTSPSTRQ